LIIEATDLKKKEIGELKKNVQTKCNMEKLIDLGKYIEAENENAQISIDNVSCHGKMH
jgi:flagellar biosynthesis/type III secretory pathway ATPase